MSLSRGLIIKSGRPTLPQYRWREPIEETLVDPAVGTFFQMVAPIGDPLIEYVTVRNVGANVWNVRFTGDGDVITSAGISTGGATHFLVLDEDEAAIGVQAAAAPFGTFGAASYQSAMFEAVRTLVGASTLRLRVRYRQL